MKINFSPEFKQAFNTLNGIGVEVLFEVDTYMDPNFVTRVHANSYPTKPIIILTIDISDFPEHDFVECEQWLDLAQKSVITFVDCKMDIGPFIGVFPTRIVYPKIFFRADKYQPSWRDWFIVDDEKFYNKNFK